MGFKEIWRYDHSLADGKCLLTVIYPGAFDPITCGHLDIIRRASGIFDMLVVAIVKRGAKDLLFNADERVDLARSSLLESGITHGVDVVAFDSLLVDYMRDKGMKIFIRGLRANSDFEYEFQMQLANRKLAPGISGIYLMPSESNIYLSSTLVKEIAGYGGDISAFVTPSVEEAVRLRCSTQANG
jgi:pantetheine-phosphate adenylyltransferase